MARVQGTFDLSFHRELARVYEQGEHAPENPIVRASYASFKRTVLSQYEYIRTRYGVQIEHLPTDAYANVSELVHDIQANRRLVVFNGGELPANHAMLEPVIWTPQGSVTLNDAFRTVHDFYGHYSPVRGDTFYPFYKPPLIGEELAYVRHAKYFDAKALLALTCETRAQTAANQSRADGEYVAQKQVLLPEWTYA